MQPDDFDDDGFEEFDADLPDQACVEIMAAIDAMPKPWRFLVYEYGFQIVMALRNEGFTNPSTVRTMLQVRARQRQDEWLATDFITPKSRRSFEAIN